jgi:hypothetical protein
LPQIQKAIQKTTGKDIKLTIVLVNKRVNQRFFSFEGGPNGRLGNPPPGTVVDSDIVAEDVYDFYLISQ